ncbi:hypothetical protein HDU93_004658 [Gonapodya sp. JEL0774]|nr:hypothetical protein HDU93_004658 [Gonapodya sp. JEL0774]
MHTAVKIAPRYSNPAVHVLDASRSVVVVSSMLDPVNKDDFVEDLKEEYEDLRQEHYDGLKERRYLTLAKAREGKLQVDWVKTPPVQKPTYLGNKIVSYELDQLLDHIDWNPFFQTWQLRGRYPNRGYPKIFNDEHVGAEAKRLFDDAQKWLKKIVDGKLLKATGFVTFWPVNAVGDDIEVYEDDTRKKVIATFHGLRQQAEKEADSSEPYLCLSDFIAPKTTGLPDYLASFAVSTGFGVEEVCKELEAVQDDYGIIMVKALADRLAEAMAEVVHQDIRRKLWGYAPDEDLKPEDMLAVKYQGIRPAPGYPSQPDHTEKETMWRLTQATELTGIQLTESLAMLPAASVSALVFAHPESKYFAVGKIGEDQVADYAARKQVTKQEIEKWLAYTVNYDIE